jgi:hypothetical protein
LKDGVSRNIFDCIGKEILQHHANGEQQVRIDALFAGNDLEAGFRP